MQIFLSLNQNRVRQSRVRQNRVRREPSEEENKYDDHGALAFFSISEKLITFSNEEVSSPSFSHIGYINAQNA